MKYPKVLVGIPTYEGKDYIFDRNFNAIKNLNYPNYDYLYVDNSVKADYLFKLKRRGANVTRVPRGGNSRQALVNAQNYLRNKVLTEGYDYLLFIESDLIPDPECINRLLAHNKHVVGSLYFLESRIEEMSLPIQKYEDVKYIAEYFHGRCSGTYKDTMVDDVNGVLRIPCIFFNEKINFIENGTRLIKPMEIMQYYHQGLRKVHGVGFGCTLIKRDVFELKVKSPDGTEKELVFWHDERDNQKHSDVYFYMELNNINFPVYVDTDVEIYHEPSDWKLVKDR